jgi:hypothetical protein
MNENSFVDLINEIPLCSDILKKHDELQQEKMIKDELLKNKFREEKDFFQRLSCLKNVVSELNSDKMINNLFVRVDEYSWDNLPKDLQESILKRGFKVEIIEILSNDNSRWEYEFTIDKDALRNRYDKLNMLSQKQKMQIQDFVSNETFNII